VPNKENVTAADAAALANRLEELRKAYDRYFLGVDKLEPVGLRRRFQQEFDGVLGAPCPNTQVRFQVAQIKGKFLTFQTYWNRVLKELEDGTYQRDKFKIELKEKSRAAAKPEATAAQPRAAEPTVENDVIDRVFRAYLLAKQKCNEPTETVSRDRLAEMLAKHANKVRESNPGTRPDFKVVIKDGKARIVVRGQTEVRNPTEARGDTAIKPRQ
jgi:hypothetical protein